MYDSLKVIKLALEMELYAHNFYKENASNLQNKKSTAIFEKLADIEYDHCMYFRKLFEKYKADEISADDLYMPNELANHFFENKIEDENFEQNLDQSMVPDLNVLRMAYLIGEDLSEFYKSMTENVEDEELKTILNDFSKLETDHTSILKDEYDRLMGIYMNTSWGG